MLTSLRNVFRPTTRTRAAFVSSSARLKKMSAPKPIICPSMLSSDFSALAAEAQRMVDFGADWLHMDVMDGHFVPNLTIGAPVIKRLRSAVKDVFLDCHLMVTNPEKWVQDFAKAGANMFTFHIEATTEPAKLIQQVKEHGMKCGIAVKPKTPLDAVIPYCDQIDMVLIMTVEPGFGGQKFMEDCVPKVAQLRKKYPNLDIQVDGGLALDTIEAAAAAGANVIVAGSSIFGAKDPKFVIESFKKTIVRHQAV